MSWMDDGGFEIRTFADKAGGAMAQMSFRTSTGHFDIILSKTEVQRIRRECGRAIKEIDQKKGAGMTDSDFRREDDAAPADKPRMASILLLALSGGPVPVGAVRHRRVPPPAGARRGLRVADHGHPPIAMAWAAGRRPDLAARLESMLGV